MRSIEIENFVLANCNCTLNARWEIYAKTKYPFGEQAVCMIPVKIQRQTLVHMPKWSEQTLVLFRIIVNVENRSSFDCELTGVV